jgi:hypothetical protein
LITSTQYGTGRSPRLKFIVWTPTRRLPGPVARTLTTQLGEQERRFRLPIHDRETKLTVPTQVSQPYRSTHRIGALGRVIHGSDELTDGD